MSHALKASFLLLLLIGLLLGPKTSAAQAYIGQTVNQFGPIQDLAAGSSHVCVANKKGQTYCWGDNHQGQLQVPKNLGRVTGLIAQKNYTCALSNQGQVACWGGGQQSAWVPMNLSGVTRLWNSNPETSLACALEISRELVCWEPLGSSSSESHLSVPLGLGNVIQESSVQYHQSGSAPVCILNQDHDWYCWRDGWVKQTGQLRQLSYNCLVLFNGSMDCDSSFTGGAVAAPRNTKGLVESAWAWAYWGYCAWGDSNSIICSQAGPLKSKKPKLVNLRKVVASIDGEWSYNTASHGDEPDPLSVRYFACALAAGDLVRCWGTKQTGELNPLPQNSVLADSSIDLAKGLAWPRQAYDIKHGWYNQAGNIKYYWQESRGKRWRALHNQKTELRISRSLLHRKIRFCASANNRLGSAVICSHPSVIISRGHLR